MICNFLKGLDFLFFYVYNLFDMKKMWCLCSKMFSVIYFFQGKIVCNINKIIVFYKCCVFFVFSNISKGFRILDLISLKFCNTIQKNLIKGVALCHLEEN